MERQNNEDIKETELARLQNIIKPDRRGNPNIGHERKTGPRTLEGKFRGKVTAGIMITGKHSKTLSKMRRCFICPLRPKETKIGDKVIITPPRCSHYSLEKGHRCHVGPLEFIERCKYYYKYIEKGDVTGMMTTMAFEQHVRSLIAEQMEMAEHGRPGFYTNEFTKSAAEILDKVQKQTYGEKHLNLNVDVTQKFLHDAFDIDNEKGEPEKKKEDKEDEKM